MTTPREDAVKFLTDMRQKMLEICTDPAPDFNGASARNRDYLAAELTALIERHRTEAAGRPSILEDFEVYLHNRPSLARDALVASAVSEMQNGGQGAYELFDLIQAQWKAMSALMAGKLEKVMQEPKHTVKEMADYFRLASEVMCDSMRRAQACEKVIEATGGPWYADRCHHMVGGEVRCEMAAVQGEAFCRRHHGAADAEMDRKLTEAIMGPEYAASHPPTRCESLCRNEGPHSWLDATSYEDMKVMQERRVCSVCGKHETQTKISQAGNPYVPLTSRPEPALSKEGGGQSFSMIGDKVMREKELKIIDAILAHKQSCTIRHTYEAGVCVKCGHKEFA